MGNHLAAAIGFMMSATLGTFSSLIIALSKEKSQYASIPLCVCFQVVACASMFAALWVAPASMVRLVGIAFGVMTLMMIAGWWALMRTFGEPMYLRRDEDDDGVMSE